MWSDRQSFFDELSDTETLSTPSSYSDSKIQGLMKVNISKTNKVLGIERESASQVSDNTKTFLANSYTSFKSRHVNTALQTLKKLDQKYTKVTKPQNINQTSNKSISHSSVKYPDSSSRKENSTPILQKPNSIRNKSRPLNKISVSDVSTPSYSEIYSKSDAEPVQKVLEVPVQLTLNRNNVMYQSDSESKVELKKTEPEKLMTVEKNIRPISMSPVPDRKQVSNSIVNKEVLKEPISDKIGWGMTEKNQKSESHTGNKTSLSDVSIQEEFSFISSASENTIITSNRKLLTDKNLVLSTPKRSSSTSVDISLTQQDKSPTGSEIQDSTNKEAAKISISQKEVEALDLSEVENLSVSSSIQHSVDSDGLFKSGPYKIFTVEDLASVERSHVDTSSVVKNNLNKKLSNENSVKNNSRHESNTLLDSEEEVDEIEKDNEQEIDKNETDYSYSSFKTNSSDDGQREQQSSHLVTIETGNKLVSAKQKALIKEVSSNSDKSSLHIVTNKSEDQNSDKRDIVLKSKRPTIEPEYKDKSVSTNYENEDSPADISALPDFREVLHNSSANKSEPLCNETVRFCNVGVQTDSNTMLYPSSTTKNEFQQSYLPPTEVHSDYAKSQSHRVVPPFHRYVSLPMGFPELVSVDMAFSEILRRQIDLTKHFMNSQQRMYEAYCNSVQSLSSGYKPVTLQDTRQFIQNHRNARLNLKVDKVEM
ncbi:uro-adherence factor A-like [Periplaneta americana]|uniref:uro-adherence factor A-like n=1 Tax=Periplaneta americana TaxID=6978 RepID=UPI0037E95C04